MRSVVFKPPTRIWGGRGCVVLILHSSYEDICVKKIFLFCQDQHGGECVCACEDRNKVTHAYLNLGVFCKCNTFRRLPVSCHSDKNSQFKTLMCSDSIFKKINVKSRTTRIVPSPIS